MNSTHCLFIYLFTVILFSRYTEIQEIDSLDIIRHCLENDTAIPRSGKSNKTREETYITGWKYFASRYDEIKYVYTERDVV